MVYKAKVLFPLLTSRNSNNASNHGFSELHDKTLDDSGYLIDSNGTTILYDVRALYGFFQLLKERDGEQIEFSIYYSYENFNVLGDLNPDEDWLPAKDKNDNDISGTLELSNFELEYVRATSKVTAVRIDLHTPISPATLNGVFSTV